MHQVRRTVSRARTRKSTRAYPARSRKRFRRREVIARVTARIRSNAARSFPSPFVPPCALLPAGIIGPLLGNLNNYHPREGKKYSDEPAGEKLAGRQRVKAEGDEKGTKWTEVAEVGGEEDSESERASEREREREKESVSSY